MSGGLSRHAGRSAPRTFVCGPVLSDRRAHSARETLGKLITEGNFSALNGANGSCGDRGRLSELGLSEATENPVVTREPLVGRDVDELAHGNVERLGDPGQKVNLRRRMTGFPVVQSAAPDLGEPREVGYGEVPGFPNLGEGAGREAAHHAPTHRHAPGATHPTMATHCAAPVWRSSQAVSIDRGIVQTAIGR